LWVIFTIAMKIISSITFFLLSLVLFSCEKAIDFKLNDVAPKLVVEASIENGQPPLVYLSKSLNYFSDVSLSVIQANFVHNAEVYVSNGALTHKLKEYITPIGGGFNFYYYSIDSANLATAFIGELRKNYSLRIVDNSKEYTAVTTIPNTTRQIDSVFWKQAPPDNDSNKVLAMITARDAPGFGDYIRYFTKRNKEPFYAGLNSVYDDQVIDGKSYTVQIERGKPRDGSSTESGTYFTKGDTVIIKLCNIDKPTYEFWRTMEFTYASVGNPFSTPTKVISNINGGALGYFGGYAAQYRTLVIPR
jgi:Domain of unknown function (DUF4249)